MSNKYRPSNGTEGELFMSKWCSNCIHGKYEHTGDTNDNPCEIASASLGFSVDDPEYPKEWVYDDSGQPKCTAFVLWDWNQDDDGNWNEPPEPPVNDPNQLCLPFILDELGIGGERQKVLPERVPGSQHMGYRGPLPQHPDLSCSDCSEVKNKISNL